MELIKIFNHALIVSFFVFVMMLLVDFINNKRPVFEIMKKGMWRQYILASFLGSTPGCLGAFMNISLYICGIISFGALVGGMIATSGDEAFVMLAKFPGVALILFILLFISGILFAYLSDKIVQFFKISTCKACLDAECEHCESLTNTKKYDYAKPADIFMNLKSLSLMRLLFILFFIFFMTLVLRGTVGPECWDWERISIIGLSICYLYIIIVVSEHYLHHHIWEHIIKKHLFRIFLWSFGALIFVQWGLSSWNLENFIQQHLLWVLLISAAMGIVPESGPHLVFVMMYAQDLIPFSVLFTSSFVQDGHGMLPMLSYSLKDTALIKIFNLFFGLVSGYALYALGY